MRTPRPGRRLLMLAILATLALPAQAGAQADPTVVDPNLAVRTVATGLSQPTGLAFIGANDMLVNEKATGRVIRIRNGVVEGPVLDLAVNSNSERGLLGIALHRNFLVNGFVYLFWSESNTGADSTSSTAVDLLANRVDRFRWTGSALVFDRNIIRFRAFQQDAGQTARGNHDGGVVRFGPDGKVYVIVGDTGRRGQMQNLEFGPFGPGIPDDQFGGPAPDDAHRTGVIVRLNDDGTAPTRQPVLRRRRGDRRRGGRQPPEDLRLRHPQQLRDGLRPDLGRPLGAGERRRLLQRAEPRGAGHELRLGADHGPVVPGRPVQGDRDEPAVLRAPADPLAAHEHRGHAGGGALPPLHAPGRALLRPGVRVEVRGRPGAGSAS